MTDPSVETNTTMKRGNMKTTNEQKLLAVLREARDELIRLYEELHPDDETDNDTTAVIDSVIKTIKAVEKQSKKTDGGAA